MQRETGTLTAWNPDANGAVYSLAMNGSTMYVGGGFTSIGGQPRNRLAAVDLAAGAATAWNPDANYNVYALAVSGSTVYAGGEYNTVGGQPRMGLAVFATPVALPVRLLNFSAQPQTSSRGTTDVQVLWATASEENSSHFEVERSPDGRAFHSVGRVAARGTVSTLSTYRFPDEAPLSGTSFYRLKQVGLDGKLAFSRVVSVHVGLQGRVALHPNLVTDNLLVAVAASGRDGLTCTVVDLSGRVVRTKSVGAGSSRIHINVATLPAGVYTLVVRGASWQEQAKFVKQ